MKQIAVGATALLIAMHSASVWSREKTNAKESVRSQQCSSYLGKTITPETFDAAIEGFSKLSPKAEFETTAEYETRKSSTLKSIEGPLIISKAPESAEYFKYDADAQKLRVQEYAFDNTNFQAWDAIYSARETKLNADTLSNIDVVVSEKQVTTGSHTAMNSLGAKLEVQDITVLTSAIFQRSAVRPGESIFLQQNKDRVIGELSLSPQEAQILKPQLGIAFVVWPKEPFLIRASYPLGQPTVRSPKKITVNATVLIADFECGLLLDGANKVIGAYDAQFRN